MDETPPVVELRNITKRFALRHHETLVAVQDISFKVAQKPSGAFVALLGPSGCGKSTILNMISGIYQPDEGEVLTMGKAVTGPNPDAVTVPQAYTCFPWLTVLGNVEFGLSIQNVQSAERRTVAMHYLEKVGLDDRASAYPRELSGGMQQRVAIARTLAVKPRIILMDEPFGALDAQTRAEMQKMLLSLWQEETNTIIFVTHDINEALLLADRIIVLSSHPGRIVYDMEVPFSRPRFGILTEQKFVQAAQVLLQMLRNEPAQAGA